MESKENIKTIKEWNDKFLSVLLEYREKHPDFRFVLRQRDVNNRLSQGYWFQGNDHYTFIGFFDRSGGTNMTRSLGFVVGYNDKEPASCYIELVYNNEKDKAVLNAYKRISEEIDGFTKISDSKFIRKYHTGDILANLNEFITVHLPVITGIVHDMKLESKLLISETKFNKILARTLSIRDSVINNVGSHSLKPLIDAFELWYASSGHRKNEDLYRDTLNPDYLQGLSKKAFIDLFFEFARDGGGIQSKGYRTAPKFKETLEADYKNTRAFLMEPFNQNFDLNSWLKRINNFNGIGPGLATIYLHRINKNKYCVVNNKSVEGFTKLGFPIKGNLTDQFGQILEASTKLIEVFPSLKNFYKTDALTHFIIGTEEGKRIIEELTGEVNYWLFQGNPTIYDVVASLKAQALKSWTVTAHKDKIKPGDRVILWVTGEKAGCYALCKVSSEVEKREDDEAELQFYTDKSENESHDRVQIEVEHNWWDQPVLKEQIISMPEFSEFHSGKQGTNYVSSRAQYEKLLELHYESALIEKISLIADRKKVEQFFSMLALAVGEFDLENDDPRISFSTPKSQTNYIAATIGQRYVISLENKAAEGHSGFELALIAATEHEKVFENWKGFKRFGDFTSPSLKIIPPHYAYFDESALPVSEELIQAWLSTIETELNRVEISSTRKYHNPFYYKAVVDTDYRKNLLDRIFKVKPDMNDYPLNQILYGPPGTGKTYNTINEALRIIDPVFYEKHQMNRKELRSRFNEHIIKDWDIEDKGRIAFITFHQSMSYEDFVEGIKPFILAEDEETADESNRLTYKIEKGIFRKICFKATTSAPIEGSFEKLWKNFTDHLFQSQQEVIFKSKTSELKLEKELSTPDSFKLRFKRSWDATKEEGQSVFHVGKSTIQRIYNQKLNLADPELRPWPTIRDMVGSGRATISLAVYNKFFEFAGLASRFNLKDANTPYVLIIDEINRGNISQIFGELISLIEEDKRIGNAEALTVILPYSKEKFGVPKNLYIIGTMNTADRSIEALDTALRRRFTFHEIQPKPYLIAEIGKSKGIIGGIDMVKMLDTINNRIEKLIDKDHKIGHSYFLDISDINGLREAFRNKIIPLLEEYFYGDFGKIGLVLGEKFVNLKHKEKKDFSFAQFGLIDQDIINDLSERKVFEISGHESWDESCFISIYQS